MEFIPLSANGCSLAMPKTPRSSKMDIKCVTSSKDLIHGLDKFAERRKAGANWGAKVLWNG
jgi:hypothetical protein